MAIKSSQPKVYRKEIPGKDPDWIVEGVTTDEEALQIVTERFGSPRKWWYVHAGKVPPSCVWEANYVLQT